MGLNPTEDAVMIGAGPAAATGLRGRDIPVVILEASDRFAALRRAPSPAGAPEYPPPPCASSNEPLLKRTTRQ